MKKLLAVAVLALALSFNACGGSSNGTQDTSDTTSKGSAASTVAATACTGSAGAGFSGAAGGLSMTIDSQKSGVSALVAEKVMQYVYAKHFAGVEKTVSYEGDNTVVLDNEVIYGDVSGSMTISGTLTATAVETQTGVTMDFGGDITVVADEFTTTQTLTTEEAGEVTYTVTLDGTWTMVFDGSVVIVVDGSGNLQSFNMNFTVTANSQAPLSVVGFGSDDSTFTGTVDINSLSVSLDYNGTGDMTPQCSGSISATIEGETGTQTCVIKSDCSACQ